MSNIINQKNPFKSHRLLGIESLRAYAALAIVFFHLHGVGKIAVPEYFGFIKTHFGFGVPLFLWLAHLAWLMVTMVSFQRRVRF